MDKLFQIEVRLDIPYSVFVKYVMNIDESARRFCLGLSMRGIKASYESSTGTIRIHNFKPSQETLMHLLITEYGDYYLEAKESSFPQ